MRERTASSSFSHRAFTLVEMLVVIAVIIVLLSLLFVALNIAGRTAQSARTQALMQSISQSLVQFKTDVGYLPPVLDNDREYVELLGNDRLPGTNDDVKAHTPNYRSVTSLADYLIGYGPGSMDGYGYAAQNESPATGIRTPGADGVWGATTSASGNRNPPLEGKVYGPYLELGDERLLGSLTASGRVAFPGEGDYDPDAPKVIADYWGEPIYYFRQPSPPGVLGQSFRGGIDYNRNGTIDASDRPTLSDVFYLRPYELDPGAATDRIGVPDETGVDTTTSYTLEAAEFAIFSAGPDRAFDPDYRVDPDLLNADNIVEVGP